MKKLKATRWSCSPIRLTLLILLSSLFLACATNRSISGGLEIPADIAGIVHAGETNTPEEYVLLDRLGVNWILTTFNWNRIESPENQWNFDSYDVYVDTAKAAGKKIIGILAYDVEWIHDDDSKRRSIPLDKIDFFLNYVRQTTTRYKGKVDAWCIWNEPNAHFWKGSEKDFFELTRQTAIVVKECDPDAVILGGAFNRNISGLPKSFIKGLFESGSMENVDAIAFHPYELNPSRTARLYAQFRSLVAQYGYEDRIWVTEVGYPTGGRYPTKTTEKQFPEYIVKTFVNLTVDGAQKILWYQLFDRPVRKKNNSEDYFGLLRSKEDFTSKGAEAFRLCAMHLAGTVYHPDMPGREKLPNSLRTFYFERETDGGTLVLWKEGPPMRVKVNLSSSGSLTVHDPVSGSAVEKPAETILTVGSMPVFVTWQNGHVNITGN